MTRSPAASAVVPVLVENHRRFLAFLERRVRSRDEAEDILQDAFVRGLAKAPPLTTDASAVAWFYQVLRNALVDHHRRAGARARALDRLAQEPVEVASAAVDDELLQTICDCVRSLVTTLKADYADAITRVDLDGVAVQTYARERGITAGNAAVRVHRAHRALERRVRETCETCADHGCRACTCRARAAGTTSAAACAPTSEV